MPRVSRRHFATSLGASVILAPFLRTLERPARAASTKKVKRLLLFCTMGTNPDMWKPSGGDTSVTFSAMTMPLSAVKQHVVLIDGMPSGNPADGHGAPDGLTGIGYSGQASALSVDQFIADKLKEAGTKTPLGSLLLGANTTAGGGRTMFYRGGNNLGTISSPLSAFTTAFGAGLPSTGSTGSTGNTAAMAALLKRRKSVLDLITGEVKTLQGRVGASEKAKLDLHLDSLRQVEERLAQSMTAGGGGSGGSAGAAMCTKPATPSDSTSNVMAANLLHLDIAVSALACDITRVAAIEFGSDQSLPVDVPDIDFKGDQHGGCLHSGAPEFKDLLKVEVWLAQHFAALVTKLKGIQEADGSGSLFDNSLLCWCRDMGDAVNHNQQDMRFVLAGGAAGYLKTSANGRYVHAAGVRHERVLLNLCEAMGITNFAGFGDPALSGANKAPYASLTG